MKTESIQRLLGIMRRLRDPQHGCPWDREQDYRSLAPYTLEEACEVVDALERGDIADLRDELGDLLFQVVFLSQIASEEGRFDFHDVANAIADKLERRHPHVFGEDSDITQSGDVRHRWEALKAEERRARGHNGVLDGVPSSLPALLRATKLGKRAARVGFDWPDAHGARGKVDEELRELDQAVAAGDDAGIDEELGDVLLALANWARLMGRDPEAALRAANRKFEARFAAMEQAAAAAGQDLQGLDAEGWERLWEAAKRR